MADERKHQKQALFWFTLAVLFVLLRAPDVAMTEAAVGAGLSSLILALALRRLGLFQLDNPSDAGGASAASEENTDA